MESIKIFYIINPVYNDLIIKSNKLLSFDIVELNPAYDQDNATARLGARCLEYIVRKSTR